MLLAILGRIERSRTVEFFLDVIGVNLDDLEVIRATDGPRLATIHVVINPRRALAVVIQNLLPDCRQVQATVRVATTDTPFAGVGRSIAVTVADLLAEALNHAAVKPGHAGHGVCNRVVPPRRITGAHCAKDI